MCTLQLLQNGKTIKSSYHPWESSPQNKLFSFISLRNDWFQWYVSQVMLYVVKVSATVVLFHIFNSFQRSLQNIPSELTQNQVLVALCEQHKYYLTIQIHLFLFQILYIIIYPYLLKNHENRRSDIYYGTKTHFATVKESFCGIEESQTSKTAVSGYSAVCLAGSSQLTSAGSRRCLLCVNIPSCLLGKHRHITHKDNVSPLPLFQRRYNVAVFSFFGMLFFIERVFRS